MCLCCFRCVGWWLRCEVSLCGCCLNFCNSVTRVLLLKFLCFGLRFVIMLQVHACSLNYYFEYVGLYCLCCDALDLCDLIYLSLGCGSLGLSRWKVGVHVGVFVNGGLLGFVISCLGWPLVLCFLCVLCVGT